MPDAQILTSFGHADPMRPTMPTILDEARVEHQTARIQVQLDDWDELASEWVDLHIGTVRARMWGISDTSTNAQSEISRQLSTPGLYGKRPTVSHSDEGAQGLVGPGGLLDQGGFFSKMQHVQYLTIGISDMFVNLGVDRRGGIAVRVVFPTEIFIIPDPDVPDRARALWHLRRRFMPSPEERWVYVWDVYDLGILTPITMPGEKPQVVEPPRFWVQEAKRRGGDIAGDLDDFEVGADITDKFFPGKDFTGAAYPWKTTAGQPRIPFVHYHDIDTGQLWNTTLRRALYHGTLNTMLYWTYGGHCMRDATGEFAIVTGVNPPPASATRARDRSPQYTDTDVGGNPPVQTVAIEPGTMFFGTKRDPDSAVTVDVIGAAVNLPDVQAFATMYEGKQAVRIGLGDSDVSRATANPTSAAALVVSNEGKREMSAQMAPAFRRRDLELFELAAIVARGAGLGTFPESGYAIEYHQIPRSPTEQRDKREQLTWEKEQGLASSLDLYKAMHNGTTDADALIALERVSREQEEVDAITETDEGTSHLPGEGTSHLSGEDDARELPPL